jgi:hypothetical protein
MKLRKTSRNDPCPCGSTIKYKNCCVKKGIDHDKLSYDEWIRIATIRAKNLVFINIVSDALQLESWATTDMDFNSFIKLLKRAITPEAIVKIYSAIPDIWPDEDDLNRCMEEEKGNHSGLFLGNYRIDSTTAFLNKHALYGESFIMIDPFLDPRNVAKEYNPLENPAEHITTTFHYILVWFQLLPWIEKGIVKIIRDPGSFNFKLHQSTLESSRLRGDSQELKKILKENINSMHNDEYYNLYMQDQMLSMSDEQILKDFKSKDFSKEEISKYIQKRRDESLFYVENNHTSQLMMFSTGTNYDMGKYICDKTNSYIVTDLNYRWQEMKYDRDINHISVNSWSPFSKAFNKVHLKHLDGLSIEDILKLRDDGYLDNMRSFMRRTWNASTSGDEFDENRIDDLSSELMFHISEAEHEWNKIDKNLLKWFGTESILGISIGIGLGSASWVPAIAMAGAGVSHLIHNKIERKNFINRYPAGFLIQSIRQKV